VSLRINQDFNYNGDDCWTWWVWLEAPNQELDGVEKVIYTLHPTFPSPRRIVTDRQSKFELRTAGWGTFRIYAEAVMKDGSTERLHHDLELLYPDGRPTTA